ncbi:DUF3352 domain-containing protein [Pleurocapsales cyanobacterium LEGE 10410]|nr:DUF3352 domain-containing protein [Pleurocapsales cyanobacterium LEGE 10410]
MNRSFIWVLITGAIAVFLLSIASLGWVATQSSIALLTGGVQAFPQATVFIPKQAVAVVSLLVNPEKLYGLRQASLPLKRRQSDRQEWQQWEQVLAAKIGLNYQQDLKSWLGDEISLAISTLDYDRNPDNGAQPGYLLAMKARDPRLARQSLINFYEKQDRVLTEKYKGADIVFLSSSKTAPQVWASAVVGNFVLFANQPQILKQAINQAQAIDLNLEQSEYYQEAIDQLERPHIALAYVNILNTSAWLDKSAIPDKSSAGQTLSADLTISKTDLAAQILTQTSDVASFYADKSFLHNPELQQIINSLNLNRPNSASIDLKQASLLEDRIPLYKVTKLAVKSLLPHLKAIAIENQGTEERVNRTSMVFKLDA